MGGVGGFSLGGVDGAGVAELDMLTRVLGRDRPLAPLPFEGDFTGGADVGDGPRFPVGDVERRLLCRVITTSPTPSRCPARVVITWVSSTCPVATSRSRIAVLSAVTWLLVSASTRTV